MFVTDMIFASAGSRHVTVLRSEIVCVDYFGTTSLANCVEVTLRGGRVFAVNKEIGKKIYSAWTGGQELGKPPVSSDPKFTEKSFGGFGASESSGKSSDDSSEYYAFQIPGREDPNQPFHVPFGHRPNEFASPAHLPGSGCFH